MAESYIIRIYRRDLTDPSKVVGVLIAQDDQAKNGRSFSSREELLQMLSIEPVSQIQEVDEGS